MMLLKPEKPLKISKEDNFRSNSWNSSQYTGNELSDPLIKEQKKKV